MSNLFTKAQGLALDTAVNYVLKYPARNFSRLLDVIETLDVTNEHAGRMEAVRPVAADPNNTWNNFIVKLCEEVQHDVLRATVRNFFFNARCWGCRNRLRVGKGMAATSPGPSS